MRGLLDLRPHTSNRPTTISHAPPAPPLQPRSLVITPPQVWDRNFQLAFWSASIYLPILIYDNPTNPFVGWSGVAVACSAVGALGGTHPPQPWGRTPCGVRLQPHLPRLQPHVLQACWWR